MFSLAALSKETAIVTPVALARLGGALLLGDRSQQSRERLHFRWIVALLSPILPLAAWYGYHYHRTGFVFGNPEFLRYNATANLDAYRIALCLWHRFLHLTTHMNMFVPVVCMVAAHAAFLRSPTNATPIARPALQGHRRHPAGQLDRLFRSRRRSADALSASDVPAYPAGLRQHVAPPHPTGVASHAALSAAAFLAGIWINPPYAFAPEDNLTYRDFIVLHQQAVRFIEQKYPQATVLTAWPAISELNRPELGYTNHPIKASPSRTSRSIRFKRQRPIPEATT